MVEGYGHFSDEQAITFPDKSLRCSAYETISVFSCSSSMMQGVMEGAVLPE